MKREIVCLPIFLSGSLPLVGQVLLTDNSGSAGTGPVVTIKATNSTGPLLDIWCLPSDTQACFEFLPNKKFVFAGNTAQYGSQDQTDASHIDLYGGTPAQGYVQDFSADISAPASFNVSVGTGGALPLGKYCFVLTYVNTTGSPRAGETTGSGSQCGDVTTLGNQKISVTHPTSPHGNAFGYQVYYCFAADHSVCTGSEVLAAITASKCTLALQTYNSNNVCDINSDAAFGSISQVGPPTIPVPTANTTGATFSGFWFISNTVPDPCFDSNAPVADCQTGDSGTVLMKNPMVALGDLTYGGTPDKLGMAVATHLV